MCPGDAEGQTVYVLDKINAVSFQPVSFTGRDEEIDPSAEFRAHFEGGNTNADVPDFVGLGIMSDGDQTKSISAADYAAFALVSE